MSVLRGILKAFIEVEAEHKRFKTFLSPQCHSHNARIEYSKGKTNRQIALNKFCLWNSTHIRDGSDLLMLPALLAEIGPSHGISLQFLQLLLEAGDWGAGARYEWYEGLCLTCVLIDVPMTRPGYWLTCTELATARTPPPTGAAGYWRISDTRTGERGGGRTTDGRQIEIGSWILQDTGCIIPW